MLKKFDSLFELFEAFPDEQSAIDHLRAIRWKNGAFCPYCKSERVMHFKDNRTEGKADGPSQSVISLRDRRERKHNG